MTELQKTTRLKIASAIFIIVIIIGFLTFRYPQYEYNLSVEQTVSELFISESVIGPHQAIDLLNSEKQEVVFIDLRSEQDYLRDDFKQAINIPVSEILAKENYSMLRKLDNEGKTLIVYGKDYLQANGAFMILKQLGFKKIKMIHDNSVLFHEIKNEEFFTYRQLEELIVSDSLYRQLTNPVQNDETKAKSSASTVSPVKRTKKSATAGGC